MDAVIAVERLVALSLAVTGLSHLAAPQAWASLFARLRTQGSAGGLINAYINFPLGALVLAFHPVWSGPGLLVTLLGLGWTTKSAAYFIRPQLAERGLAAVEGDRAWRLQAAGAAMVALAAVVAWLSLR